MKVVILAGGLGTRISEESHVRPKPMIEIGGRPILWHIMKLYSSHGFNDFVICAGYKGYMIKEYFANYFLHNSDVTFHLGKNEQVIHESTSENWSVTVVDTGEQTQTGGRLKRVRKYLGDEDFHFTYGDGLSDVDLKNLVRFHKEQGGLATVTAVAPPGRFGLVNVNANSKVTNFIEKPKGDGGLINGGFFVLSPKVIDYIDNDQSIWERDPMEKLAIQGNLNAFHHEGFWQAMDTLRDKNSLETLWASGKAPWKLWS